MNEVTKISTNQPTIVTSVKNNVNFKSDKVSIPGLNDNDVFIKDYEKAKKQAETDRKIQRYTAVGSVLASFAILGLFAYMYLGKGAPKTVFTKISDKMPNLTDECINPKSRHFIEQVTKILKTPQDLLNYTGAKNPRMVLFHGSTGTGKTFTAKMLAKEMGAEYGEIQFSDLSSEYVGKTAVNISRKFKELKKLAEKNPKKQYVVAFNEIDSLIGNVEKLGANNRHLGQNRTSFLNGLDLIKNTPNLTIVGTTNINPNSAQLDAATLSRLGNIFEIGKTTVPEAKSSFKFHLAKSEAAKDLIKNDAEIEKLAKSVVGKNGVQRDIENIVDTALTDFTIAINGKPDAKKMQLTSDYIQKVIDSKETWAAGIKTASTPIETEAQGQIPNKLVDEFYKFIAQRMGAI